MVIFFFLLFFTTTCSWSFVRLNQSYRADNIDFPLCAQLASEFSKDFMFAPSFKFHFFLSARHFSPAVEVQVAAKSRINLISTYTVDVAGDNVFKRVFSHSPFVKEWSVE